MTGRERSCSAPLGRRGKALSWISSRGGYLLDVGCGPTGWDSPFASLSGDVIALDLNKSFLTRGGTTSNIHMLLGDASSLPFSDECIDAVVATEVLEHVPSDSAMISELRRVLKPDGQLIITVPNKGMSGILDPSHFCLARAALRVIGRDAQPIHRHYSLRELSAILGNDFEIEKVSRTGSWATGVCVLLVQFSKLVGSRALQDLFNTIGAYDYQLDYGAAAYNLALSAKKVNKPSR